jgi:hypothetical protein
MVEKTQPNLDKLPNIQQNTPYGQWRSPISAVQVAEGALDLSQVRIVGEDAYWLESRPAENGRIALICASSDGVTHEIIAAPFNVRSRVHEYGGAAYLPIDFGEVSDGARTFVRSMVFSHFTDNGLYFQLGKNPVLKLTANSKHRFVDIIHDEKHVRCIGVREDHSASAIQPIAQPVNTICAISIDGSATQTVLVQGSDFYAAPRLSHDGRQLAWLSWNHPCMPWTGT